MKIKIEDLLKMEIDRDVTDDYSDELYISFVGPIELTEYGKKVFRGILSLECDVYDDIIVVHCDADDEDKSEYNLRKCAKLFGALALGSRNYRRWFVSEDDVVSALNRKEIKIVNVDEWPEVDTYELPSITHDLSHGTGNVVMYYEYCPEEDVIYCHVSH